MQNVASSTRSVKVSSGWRATILNGVRTVYNPKTIMLYTFAFDKG